jgi:hypothetical protein
MAKKKGGKRGAEKASHTKKLPAALAARARAASDAKRARDTTRALELVLLIQRRKERISEDFYDIGMALQELQAPETYRALGCATFAEVLERVDISNELANELLGIVRQVPRRLAVAVGQTKAAALVELAAATPEDDTPEQLATAKLVVRGRHRPVDLATSSAKEIRRLARDVRREHAKEGSAIRNAEAIARRLERALERAGVRRVKVRVLRRRRKGEKEAYDMHLAFPLEASARVGRVLVDEG